ncbi:sensor histidine kinase KdpD [uncultured Brevundimonas sp.]|uniref:sensor histidine kinase n=1 Tax=uncultured Brevundimonas sp. TaxID=213418 RepID=UPI0025E5325C|nr:sensor histidine kinase [uncultured Brevundimonas sp.]
MFALPTLIRRASGSYTFHNSGPDPLPLELRDKVRIDRYLALTKGGWHTLEFGYQCYVQMAPGGDAFIFPGIILEDGPRIAKRFHGYAKQRSRSEVESTARSMAAYVNEERGIAQEDLNILIHDLRGLSSAIYNSALQAESAIKEARTYDAGQQVKSVLAWQGMLKMRTDALDFVGNPATVISDAHIPAYRKIHKVVRCFQATVEQQNKSIEIFGASFKRLYGPNIFELMPYTLLDNAIKYSPPGETIRVGIQDGPPFSFCVESLGPRIAPEELAEIFNKGGRGREAVASGVPGSGVGLHMLQRIVDERFGGKISVSQSETQTWRGDMAYYLTRFSITLPES